MAKEELDRMEKLAVISKVDEPTDWVSSMVLVEKPGKIRICLDPCNLNKSMLTEEASKLTTLYTSFGR